MISARKTLIAMMKNSGVPKPGSPRSAVLVAMTKSKRQKATYTMGATRARTHTLFKTDETRMPRR